MDIHVRRNAYGRQLESEIRQGESNFAGGPLEMVFIRAPKIEKMGKDVEVLAKVGDEPVLVRQGKTMVSTFHPELSEDRRVQVESVRKPVLEERPVRETGQVVMERLVV